MQVKILTEDSIFSQYVRLRDGKCQRCSSKVKFNEKGDPISHSVSHYISRGNWAVRMDEDNSITLCFPCHRLWAGDEKEDYTLFMKSWLGEPAFRNLLMRSNEYADKRKIREWAKKEYRPKIQRLKNKKK